MWSNSKYSHAIVDCLSYDIQINIYFESDYSSNKLIRSDKNLWKKPNWVYWESAQKLVYSSSVSTNRTCVDCVKYDIIDAIIWRHDSMRFKVTKPILNFFTNVKFGQSFELKSTRSFGLVTVACDYHYILSHVLTFFHNIQFCTNE